MSDKQDGPWFCKLEVVPYLTTRSGLEHENVGAEEMGISRSQPESHIPNIFTVTNQIAQVYKGSWITNIVWYRLSLYLL